AAAEATRGTADLCLIRYNSLHTGAREDLFPQVANRRARVYNFTSTTGYVTPRRFAELGLDPAMWCPGVVDHYRYVLTRPEIDGLLVQLGAEDHVAALGEALEQGPLEPEEAEHLELLSRLAYPRTP